MLSTLAFLSGSYTAANLGLLYKNLQLVKNGNLLTMKGWRDLRLLPVKDSGIMYKIYENNDCVKYGYTFAFKQLVRYRGKDENSLMMCPFDTEYFNTEKQFIGPGEFFNKNDIVKVDIKCNNAKFYVEYVDVTKDDKIWVVSYLKNLDNCDIIAKMDNDEFKTLMAYEHQLPFRKTILCVFLLTCIMMCYFHIF